MGEMMHFPDTVEEFMELFKVIDSDHVYSNGIEFVPIFRMQQWFEHLKAQPKTEGDKIRGMDDEELAETLMKQCSERSCPETDCFKCWTNWLKQECE